MSFVKCDRIDSNRVEAGTECKILICTIILIYVSNIQRYFNLYRNRKILMAYIKSHSYCDIPFCVDTPHHDFYTYSDLKDIADKCNILGDEIMKCRTVGILKSVNGRFYLSDINDTEVHSEPLVQVSMVYLKSPPHSTVIPYPVQVFGTLQWKNRPVIFAKILQVLSVSNAIRVKNALSGITHLHLARNGPEDELQDNPP